MKTIRKTARTTTLMTVLLLSISNMMAQDANQNIRPDIPPSPQAVAFNRLGNYQVDNNYGMPDISIPLYEIDFHGYKIPLTLRYEASPLKPGYNYDVTGLGWTLSGNSCVSRIIKDVADECATGKSFTLDNFKTTSGADKLYLDNQYNLGKLNFQYDSYSIVLPSGRTIPFYIHRVDGVMQCKLMSPDRCIKIKCDNKPNFLYGFTVTDENGITYKFTLPEKTTNGFQNDINADRNVTWLLTSIDIPSKGRITYQYTDPIAIYTQNILREPVVSVRRLFDDWHIWKNEKSFKVKADFQKQSPVYYMVFVKNIFYDSSRIDFNYQNDNQHLKEIVVSDHDKPIRTLSFKLSGSSGDLNRQLLSLVISGKDDEGKEDRLKYDFSYHGISSGDNYTDYWGNRCKPGPTRYANNGQPINHNGLDDLGNFNMYFSNKGITNETGEGISWNDLQDQLSRDGILAQLVENNEGDPNYWKLKLQSTTEGDTRVPTPPEMHGVLSSITYPNGGKTIFEWENHRFPTATAANGDIVYDRRSQRIIEGGGFRIKSIKNYPVDGPASADYYRYGFTIGDIMHRNFPLPLPSYYNTSNISFNDTINKHIGCGEAVVDPNLFSFMDFSYSVTPLPENNNTYSANYSYAPPAEFRKMLVGQDSRFKDISNKDGIPTWWEATFSTLKFQSLIGGRRPVVYPEITVYHGNPDLLETCKSKTVYKYNIYKYEYPDAIESNYLTSFSQVAESDTAYFEALCFDGSSPALSCYERPADRHQLKSKSDYSYDNGKWELVSEESYSYNKYEISEEGYVFESIYSRDNYYPNDFSYGQIGFHHPLLGAPLCDFYKKNTQYLGRFELCGKSTTIRRMDGNQSLYNTQTESYVYLYSGVLLNRLYTDIYDKADIYSYSSIDLDNKDADILAPAYDAMKERNILTALTSAETIADLPEEYVGTGTKIYYKLYDNNVLPFKLYESNGDEYEESLEVKSYDSHGNPTEIIDLKTGIHSVYLWDEDGRYMIAMINDADLSQIENIPLLLAASSQARHAMLQERFPKSQVQTWDYKPLVGVSTFTDINGQTILYEYDGLGRLKSENRIVNGKTTSDTIHKYEYNYKN